MLGDPDFIRAILADPEDPGPRLAYSDWLEEHGDPARAEVIRLDVALRPASRFTSLASNPGDMALRERRVRLLMEHADRWAGGLPVVPGVRWGRLFGGLADQVEIDDPEAFRAHAGLILDAQPVTCFTLAERRQHSGSPLRTILEAPEMIRLGGFNGWPGYPGGTLARVIAEAETLANLRWLDLHQTALSSNGAVELARAGHLRDLRELDLSRNGITGRGLRAIADAPCFGNLRLLALGFNPVGDDAPRLLFRLARLEALDLGHCGIGPEGISGFAASGCGARLARLHLQGNPIGRVGFSALAKAPQLSKLAHLDLSDCEIGPERYLRIERASFLGHLRRLAMSRNPIGDRGVRAIAEGASRLEVLHLSGIGAGDDGARALAAAGPFPDLVELDLSDNAIGDAGARAIAESGAFPGLQVLDLSGNAIGDDGAQALAGSASLGSLQWLKIADDRPGGGVV